MTRFRRLKSWLLYHVFGIGFRCCWCKSVGNMPVFMRENGTTVCFDCLKRRDAK